MNLTNQLQSLYDERSLGDSGLRSSLFRIEQNRTTYGSFTSFDTVDYFQITPGAGSFRLIITNDPANGFAQSYSSSYFYPKITDQFGSSIFSINAVRTTVDTYTDVITFNSTAGATYYVQIDKLLSGVSFQYAATLKALGLTLNGTAGNDVLAGGAEDDVLGGLGGNDTITGGFGNDAIDGGDGLNYLRGDEGNDQIIGGSSFDDINGNMGDDTCRGGFGDDWVVGGKDNDLLFGDAGDDIVYGNIGDDTCDGGDGADIVRGGQGNDVVRGGAGADWLAGDRGDDTLTGGAGADIFHTHGDAGLDRVADFNRAEGDRVYLLPGTHYTLAQEGADVAINMVGGGKMLLVGVQLSSLAGDWIF